MGRSGKVRSPDLGLQRGTRPLAVRSHIPSRTGGQERSLCVCRPDANTPRAAPSSAPRGAHPPQPIGALRAQWHNSIGCASTRAHALQRKRGKEEEEGVQGEGGGWWVGWGFQVEAPPTTQALLPLAPPWTCRPLCRELRWPAAPRPHSGRPWR